MPLPLRTRELIMNLDDIYQTIEHGENEGATRSETLSVFARWAQGAYGSGPDTDMFIICPRTTDGTVMLEGNYARVLDSFAKRGEPQGVLVFEATLEYTRKGLPINMGAFTPPWVTAKPLSKRAVYVFDKDTMIKQQSILKNVRDLRGRRLCAVSATNEGAVLPRNAFTSRPPDHTLFSQRFRGDHYRGTIAEVYIIPAVVLIPKNRIRRALHFEREITNTISSLKSTESSALGNPEWELPIYLKCFPIEADRVHLLELLDISVTRREFKVWEEVMEVLCRFKPVDGIGSSRISAAVKGFSFKKVQPFLDTFITGFRTVDDISSFIAKIKEASEHDQDEVDRWCADQEDYRIMKILGSDEKTLQSLVQYGFVKGLPLLTGIIQSLSEDKTVGFTFWASLVTHLDRQWQSVNSSSFTGAPLRELNSMLDRCIATMTPLMSEGAVYTPVPPHLVDDIHHNAEVHVRRTVILVEMCLRFSSVRCGDVLSHIFFIPGDVQTKFDLFLRPFAPGLRSLLGQYGFTIFQPPFFVFYRLLVGIYLGFCLGNGLVRRGEPSSSFARLLCTKKVVCDRCEFIVDFLSSGDQSREFYVTNKEWKHLRYVFLKLQDKISRPAATSRGPGKTVRINKRPKPRGEAAKEFLQVIGSEEEILRLMEPLGEEVSKALKDEGPFDFDLCLQLPPPLTGSSQTA